MITLATGTAVVMGDVSAGWAGLALTYALALSDSLLVRYLWLFFSALDADGAL